ncbi:SURF1 family cytochrome oxidase biogenesis protein [Hoyosella subflava]|uniref:SURF1-like protein n=1 Tax=Hoyosella subflava (strain DSM 45089 / JCM 17490 / NBRC 109087 / DQS3-9A1) TaxID=443218 RepID=F6EEJ3_HOYSD|nr:SURF1 family protein [Hoyosella subflava]AEF39690.1 Transmembrane protein [Hoyosella subflava DQS3-9A1]
MRRFSFLFRPGWLALVAVVGVFAYLCFTILAPWQLGKNTATEHRNTLIERSVEAEPVSIGELAGSGATPERDDEWRRVTLSGTYLPEHEVVARLRSIEGTPSFEVLTPFRLDDGSEVLINRGFVHTEQGTDVPEFAPAPAGQRTLEGRIRMPEAALGREPIISDGTTQVYSINPGEIGALADISLPGYYIQLAPEQPGGLGLIGLPQLDRGPFLSYGLQWIAFGIMAPLGLLYFVRAELRERKTSRSNEPGTADPDSGPVVYAEAEQATSRTPEEKLASRYGKRR